MLKACYRQYQQYSKVQTMLKNNLNLPAGHYFSRCKPPVHQSAPRRWPREVDRLCSYFLASPSAFVTCLRRPLPPNTRSGARSTATISVKARRWTFMPPPVGTSVSCPKPDTAKLLVQQAISQLRATSSALAALKQEMQSLAASLPEYPVVDGDVWCWPYSRPSTHG